jgi:hypothetical protein
MIKKRRRVYEPRMVGDQIMTPADLKRLHKYMVEIDGIRPRWAVTRRSQFPA